jgi:hypothetical protein
MSRAAVLGSQYQRKIAKAGQWIAIRRYSGTGQSRAFTDILARGYVRYALDTEFVGGVVQGNLMVWVLMDSTLAALNPAINTSTDRLLTGFYGCDNPNTTPPLTGGLVSSPKERAIRSVMEIVPGGTLIALKMVAVG